MKDTSNELYHFGVKGMKWGIINEDKPTGKLFGKSPDTSNPRDHSYSDKTEALNFALNVANKVAFGSNAIEKAQIATRLGKAIVGETKNAIFDNQRNSNPVDESTGLHLKTKEMSMKEDLARINPEFNNFDANSKSNCMLCTTAYDMRRRGYDVEANKALWGYDPPDLSYWYEGVKVESPNLRDEVYMGDQMTEEESQKLCDELTKQGDGARGNLMVYWPYGGGHSVAYEVQNGKVIILDGQVNKVYKNPYDFLKDARPDVQYARLDNKKINKKHIKEAVS